MRGMLVDDGCNRIVANDIDAAAHKHEALRRKVRNLRGFRQPRRKPRLDRVPVGRRDIKGLRGQLIPDMAGDDLPRYILAQIVALHRQHDGA
jgi:hypothetical protein